MLQTGMCLTHAEVMSDFAFAFSRKQESEYRYAFMKWGQLQVQFTLVYRPMLKITDSQIANSLQPGHTKFLKQSYTVKKYTQEFVQLF